MGGKEQVTKSLRIAYHFQLSPAALLQKTHFDFCQDKLSKQKYL